MAEHEAAGTRRQGRGDGPYWLLLAGCVAVVLFFDVLNTMHDRARAGVAVPVWEPTVWEISSGLVLFALTPAVLWLIRRTLLTPMPLWRALAWHVPAALVYSLIHVAAMGALRGGVYALVGARYDPLGPLSEWPYELRKDLLVYAVLVVTYWGYRRITDQPAQPASGGGEPAVLEVRDGAKRYLIPIDDIALVEAAGNYVEVHTASKSVLHRAPLSRIERELAPAGLVRIHRSRLVNRTQVAEIETKPSGDFELLLRDGRRVAGSRRFRAGLG